jgi:hypothetical protein
MRAGVAELSKLARVAVARLLGLGAYSLAAGRLFTEPERVQLAEVLASVNATAELLGRSLIRDQQQKTIERRGTVTEALIVLNESLLSVTPPLMGPAEALSYFSSLVPTLGVDPLRFGPDQRRKAFTLAVATDTQLLGHVKDIIRDRLATGQEVSDAPAEIEDVLERAGVTPKNPQYSEMTFRTSMMDSYNIGAEAEMRHPDVASFFPSWQYLGVRDGRQGEDHEPHFDKYYPNGVSFHSVRGPRVFNCRCTFRPIDKFDWSALQSQGARLEAGV